MAQRSIEECNAALNARNSLIDGGTVEIRSGALTDIDLPPTGDLLVSFTLPSPAFNDADNRSSSAKAIPKTQATLPNNGGTVHFVVKDSLGYVRRSGTAGLSATDMILSKLTWNAGEELSIVSWVNSELKGAL